MANDELFLWVDNGTHQTKPEFFSKKNSLIIELLLSKIIENKIITIFQLIKRHIY